MHARAVSDQDMTAVSDSTLVSTLESTLSLRSTVQLGIPIRTDSILLYMYSNSLSQAY